MKFDRSGIMIAINSTDRTLRVYKKTEDSPDIEPVWEHFTDITDPVNRLQWKTYCFSRDAENLISGSAERAEHNIIIWSLQSPAILSRVLEGPKEGLMHVCVIPFFFPFFLQAFFFLTFVNSGTLVYQFCCPARPLG